MTEILNIENQCFEYRWSEEDFLKVLRERNCIGMVAEHNEMIVGYCVYLLYPSALEIINIAVDPVVQRESVGSMMVNRLKDKLALHKRNQIFLAVRESNTPAHLFLKACGFNAYSIHENMYEDSEEDAYLFRYLQERPDSDFAPGLSPSNRISDYLKGTA